MSFRLGKGAFAHTHHAGDVGNGAVKHIALRLARPAHADDFQLARFGILLGNHRLNEFGTDVQRQNGVFIGLGGNVGNFFDGFLSKQIHSFRLSLTWVSWLI